ncbi:glycosyltransferase [Aquirufa antheringensis]|uniref:Glycosyltransferase n=1 Tax=Aquirufa antheringensis TaxID=2516559 RepID=A0A4Q9BG45_9BACT|nr:glycosyltransferase family 4 protein [Aquirufa antheringensis]TBH75057.1 glycosyltransferase [Aquirufa antheringensis]
MSEVLINIVSISNLSDKNGVSTFINGFDKLKELFNSNGIIINKVFVPVGSKSSVTENSFSRNSITNFKSRVLKKNRVYKILQFLYFYIFQAIVIAIRVFNFYFLNKSHRNQVFFFNDLFVAFFAIKLLPKNSKTIIIFHSSEDPLRHFFMIFEFLKNTFIENFLRYMLHFVMINVCGIVTLSEGYAQKLQKSFPNKTIKCIYNTSFVNYVKNDFEGSAFRKSDFINIIAIGSLQYCKGFDILISAIGELSLNVRRKFILRIAGEGEERTNLESLIAKYDLYDNVLLLGNIDNVGPLIEQCSFFCLPSREEGLPISLIEALSFYKPIICTPVGSLPEIFSENDCVFINQDVSDIVRVLNSLFENSMQLETLSFNSSKIFNSLFSNQSFVEKYSLFFKQIIK